MHQAAAKLLPGFVHHWLRKLRQEENSRILVSGASSAFVIKVIGAALNFITQVLLARMLGVQGYGFFAYATSWMILLSIPAQLGLRDSLIRFVPEYEATNRPGHIRGILRFALRATFLSAVVIAGLFAIVLLTSPGFWAREQIAVLWIMLGVLPVFTLNRIRESGLRAFRRVALAFAPEHIIRPIVLCGLCALIFLSSKELLAWQAWFCNMAALGAAFLVGSWWLFQSLPGEVRSAKPEQSHRHWLVVSLPMFMMTGMNVVMNQSGVVLLGFFIPPAEVGVYAVCVRIMILVNFAVTSVDAMIGPLISRLYYAGQKQELQNMLTLAAWGIFLITCLTCGFLSLFGTYVLNFFGPAFVQGYTPLLILILGQLINALAGSVAFIMITTGYQIKAVRIVGIAATFNIIISFLLIPTLGIYGAALSSAISISLVKLLMLKSVLKKIHLNPTIIRIKGF